MDCVTWFNSKFKASNYQARIVWEKEKNRPVKFEETLGCDHKPFSHEELLHLRIEISLTMKM